MTARKPMPKCRHDGRAIVTCVSLPLPHACPPGSHGWVHNGSHQHRCGPQAPTTYAQPKAASDG